MSKPKTDILWDLIRDCPIGKGGIMVTLKQKAKEAGYELLDKTFDEIFELLDQTTLDSKFIEQFTLILDTVDCIVEEELHNKLPENEKILSYNKFEFNLLLLHNRKIGDPNFDKDKVKYHFFDPKLIFIDHKLYVKCNNGCDQKVEIR